MVDRRERVILELVDGGFSSKMAKDAAATALLNRELNNLSGQSVETSRDSDRVAQSLSKVGTEAEKSSTALRRGTADINQFSGRLRLLTEAATVLGPALVPIGAVAVPAVVALAGGLAAAAASAGVAVLAFHGIGDALKALNEYQIDPSTAHLEKMREEFEKIGPTGVEFVRFLDGLEPQLKDLQELARQGLFPGVEEGITSLLDMLPQVRLIVFDLATELGHLASQAGTALSGDEFSAFFDYLQSDAVPTLDAFAHTIGNVFQGLGSLLVAFAPLSRDFSSGMESMSQSFADWAANLSKTDGFREFVAYVRESGPQVLALLGSLATAFIGIAQAAAPVGALVVPALTALANVLGAIASSPIGGPLFTAVAAMVALSRAGKIAAGSLDMVGVSSEKAKAGLSRVAGTAAGVVAVGIAVGALADGIGRIDSQNLERSLTALSMGNVTDEINDIVGNIEELNKAANSIDFGEIATAGGLFGDSTLDKYADNVDQVDQKLAQLVESGNAQEAARLFAEITRLAEEQGVSTEDTAKSFDAYKLALDNASPSGDHAADVARKLAQAHNRQAASAEEAAESTASLVGAMQDEATAALGAFDAETQYREALKAAAAQAKKNEAGIRGNTDAALANRSSLSQLAGAWNNQSAAVKNNVGRWKEAKSAFIETAVAMNVPIEKAKALADRLMQIPKSVVIKQQNNMDPAVKTAKLLAQAIRNIPTSWLTNYTINTTRTGVVAGMAGGRDGDPSTPYASGGFTGRGPRLKPAGIVHTGEVVLPQEVVRRDKSMLMARYGNLPNMSELPGFATGGAVGARRNNQDRYTPTAMWGLMGAVDDATVTFQNFSKIGLKELKQRDHILDRQIKQADKELEASRDRLSELREQLKAMKDARREFVNSVKSNFMSDLFGDTDLVAAIRDGLVPSEELAKVQAFAQANGTGEGTLQQQIAEYYRSLSDADKLKFMGMSSGDQRSQYLGTLTMEQQVQGYLDSLSTSQIAMLQAQANTGILGNNTRDATSFAALLKQLRAAGLTGGAYKELALSGNLSQAQAYASMDPAMIQQLVQDYKDRNKAVGALGQSAIPPAMNHAIQQQARAAERQANLTHQLNEGVKELNRLSKVVDHRLQQLTDIEKHQAAAISKGVGDVINKSSVTRGPK